MQCVSVSAYVLQLYPNFWNTQSGVSVYFSMVGDTIFQVGESHPPPPPPFRPQCAAGKKKSGLCWGSLDWLKLHLPHLFILVLYNEFHDFYHERFKKKL